MRLIHLVAVSVYVATLVAPFAWYAHDRSLLTEEKLLIGLALTIPTTVALGFPAMFPTRCPRCKTWSLGPENPFRLPLLRATRTRWCNRCHHTFRKTRGAPWERVEAAPPGWL